MIFVIYWISWNVCLCWYCCFHVVQSSQQNQQCRKIVTQIFRCIFLSAKLVLHCFFVFILSTNLTNVTICGKLYWIFLLILFLCNTFIKKNYFQCFFHIYIKWDSEFSLKYLHVISFPAWSCELLNLMCVFEWFIYPILILFPFPFFLSAAWNCIRLWPLTRVHRPKILPRPWPLFNPNMHLWQFRSVNWRWSRFQLSDITG